MRKRRILILTVSLLVGIPVVLALAFCLASFLVLNWPCLFPKGLTYSDYGAVFQLPLGSTREEVVAFLEDRGIHEQDEGSVGLDCEQYYNSSDRIEVQLCACGVVGGYVDVEFHFDGGARLRDVVVEYGPT